MPIADDWDFNFSGGVISHIDGVLTYDTGSGTQPAVGDYILGATSGAIGKILARTGTATAGTFTLTNVLGKFENNETLSVLSYVDFDNVGNGGFDVGDTLVDQVTGSIDVKFIEYNIDGVAGHGRVYGNNMTAFTNNSQIDISGGATAVALADGVGVDNDALWSGQPDGGLAPPGTANTNNCEIVHYDAGTIAIPEDAHITDVTSGADGYAQRVFGSVSTGSIRVVDSDTTGGAWGNNNTLRILDCEYYDTLVAGKVFSVGDVLKGATSGFQARVLAVIDDGDNTGKLILAGNTGTPWTDGEAIQVRQSDDTYVTYANVESAQNSYLDAATLNLPAGSRKLQRADQGGIYPTASLNIVRSANALYSYAMTLYAQVNQLDDEVPFDGNVRDQLYTILNNYIIPDLSFRFIEKGSFKDSGNNNVFPNVKTAGVVADIGNHGFFYDSVNPTPRPDMYIEQDGAVIRQDWLEGHLDVLIKTKSNTHPKYINPAVPALGQLINGGALTVHLRPYSRTYDSAEVVAADAGFANVFISNSVDDNNATGQYQFAYTGGTGTPFTPGEEATTPGGKRVQIVTSDTGATGNITYILKSGTNLVATDVLTGTVSGASATMSGTVTNLVAGYGTDIRIMVVQRRFTGGTTTGTYVLGELVTQTGTGATGFFMEDDAGAIYIEEQSGTFNGTGLLTGAVSGATNTPSATNAQSTVPKDIGGGVGDQDYTAVVSADITDASPQTVQKVYEWWKFNTARESLYQVNTPGGLFSDYTEGRIYRRLQSTYAEVRGASPFGSKAGTLVTSAQGVFIEKFTLDTADIRSIKLVANNGSTYDPPNLQVMATGAVFNGVAVSMYRAPGAGQQAILRNEFTVGAVGGGFNQAADADIKLAAGTRSVSPLPNDVPDSGVLRILNPSGGPNSYLRFIYDTVDRVNNTFHLQQGIGQNTIGDVTGAVDLNATDNAHVVFVEEVASGALVSNTIQYVSDIPVYVHARIKGRKPFKTAATFGATGLTVGAVLNNDDVVNLP